MDSNDRGNETAMASDSAWLRAAESYAALHGEDLITPLRRWLSSLPDHFAGPLDNALGSTMEEMLRTTGIVEAQLDGPRVYLIDHDDTTARFRLEDLATLTLRRTPSGGRLESLTPTPEVQSTFARLAGRRHRFTAMIGRWSHPLWSKRFVQDGREVPASVPEFLDALNRILADLHTILERWRERHATYARRHGDAEFRDPAIDLVDRLCTLMPRITIGPPRSVRPDDASSTRRIVVTLEVQSVFMGQRPWKVPLVLDLDGDPLRVSDAHLAVRWLGPPWSLASLCQSLSNQLTPSPQAPVQTLSCQPCEGTGIRNRRRVVPPRGPLSLWYQFFSEYSPDILGAPLDYCEFCRGCGYRRTDGTVPDLPRRPSAIADVEASRRPPLPAVAGLSLLGILCAVAAGLIWFLPFQDAEELKDFTGFVVVLVMMAGLFSYVAVGCLCHLIFYPKLRWESVLDPEHLNGYSTDL